MVVKVQPIDCIEVITLNQLHLTLWKLPIFARNFAKRRKRNSIDPVAVVERVSEMQHRQKPSFYHHREIPLMFYLVGCYSAQGQSGKPSNKNYKFVRI